MAVRMKDIALDLGLSVVTISKVLRNHNDISAETRERVLKRMKELHYRPNLAARSLVTGKSYLIGLIVPDLVHPFYSQLAKGVSKVLRKKGYSLILSSSEEDPDLEKQEIEQLLSRNLDVFLIASTQGSVESFRRIEEHKKPYILIDRKFAGLAANFIGCDDRLIGRLATEHLIEIGCRRIAYIGGETTSPSLERLEGYRQTLIHHGLPSPASYIACRAHGDDSGDLTGYQIMQSLLQLDPYPDGIFCYNDPMAMGAMKALLEASIKIPEQVAIIGCGNVHYGPLLRVPLTTVDQQSELLGERAAKLALALGESKGFPQKPRTFLMQTRIIQRDSTQRRPS